MKDLLFKLAVCLAIGMIVGFAFTMVFYLALWIIAASPPLWVRVFLFGTLFGFGGAWLSLSDWMEL